MAKSTVIVYNVTLVRIGQGDTIMSVKKDCLHKFVATQKKGKWKVRVLATVNKDKFSIQEVTTTFFECSVCGAKKEFPNNWEKNFVAPEKTLVESSRAKSPLKPPAQKRIKTAV